jgi:hypothetical protein
MAEGAAEIARAVQHVEVRGCHQYFAWEGGGVRAGRTDGGRVGVGSAASLASRHSCRWNERTAASSSALSNESDKASVVLVPFVPVDRRASHLC